MISSKTKIGLLVAGHVVTGLLLAQRQIAGYPLKVLGLYALMFAEAGLVGIWGGLSATRLAWRLPAVIAAIVYLWAVQVIALRPAEKTPNFLITALTTLPVLVVLSVLRLGRRKRRLANLASESPASEGFQFSIRHVLMATAIVAVVLGIGRGVRTITNPQWSWMLPVAIFPPCHIMVELATLWAALGVRRPTPRLATVVLAAFSVAAIPMYYMGNLVWADWSHLIFWSAMFGIQSIITALSLLVVRSCGFRLVRGTVGGAEQRQEIEPMAYSESLADRLRRAFGRRRGLEE